MNCEAARDVVLARTLVEIFHPSRPPPHSLDSDLRGLHRDCGRLPGLLWDGHDEDPGPIQDPGVQQGSNNERMTFKTGVTSDLFPGLLFLSELFVLSFLFLFFDLKRQKRGFLLSHNLFYKTK